MPGRTCSRPVRLRANYHKPHGTRQLFAWYSVGDNRLYGRIEVRKKGAARRFARSRRSARCDPTADRST